MVRGRSSRLGVEVKGDTDRVDLTKTAVPPLCLLRSSNEVLRLQSEKF